MHCNSCFLLCFNQNIEKLFIYSLLESHFRASVVKNILQISYLRQFGKKASGNQHCFRFFKPKCRQQMAFLSTLKKLCYMEAERIPSSTENYVFSNVCDHIIMQCNVFNGDLYLSKSFQMAICLQAVIITIVMNSYHEISIKATTITLKCFA